uniref:BAHD-type malonyltransferase 4 n=1 Tax=Digitalis lanata TaxID=49450 RepID=A0A8F2DDT8_DIGLA|nr:BAHD-type malonyltransferase 4 [Digitalis lanata]
MVSVLERCRVAPSDGAAEELKLPFTFFDMFWVELHLVQRLLFYKCPCSKSHFVDEIVPNIKRSLALALKHFLAFAGNFVYPLSPTSLPEIQYKIGDSISVTFSVSNDDFHYFIENQARGADKFYPFLPQLPPTIHGADSRLIPIIAVQVTLFPGSGMVVGLTNHHVVGDASSTVSFIKAWTSICKFGDDAQFVLPLYDRCLIKDPNGKLAQKFWDELRRVELRETNPRIFSAGKLRATFIMEDAKIQKLKNQMILGNSCSHISKFTVVCGFVWSCLAKSGAAIGEEDGVSSFIVAADFRSRLDPPLPSNYFGNCIGPCIAKSPRLRLIGSDGFLNAAELIGEAIYQRFFKYGEGGVLRGVEDWPSEINSVDWSRALGTAGSPRFDVYDADFGWGKPAKFESVSIDADGSMSICKSRDSEKDLEIGISLPKIKMDAFAAIF